MIATSPLPQAKPTQPENKLPWPLILGVAAFSFLAIAFLIRTFTPTTTNIPQQDNTISGITPGYSTDTDVTKKFGNPLDTRQTARGTTRFYQSQYPEIPHEVAYSSSGKVAFIKEQLSYENPPTVTSYIERYGQPDLELFYELGGNASRAYVFLKVGIVAIANINTKTLQERWSFEPTDEKTFREKWGQELTTSPEGPESLNL